MDPDPEGFSFIYHSLFSEYFLLVALPGEFIISVFLILILLCCSALISGSEVAYFSLTHNDIDDLKKENGDSPSSKRVVELMKQPAYLLATILIANNFINIAIIIFSEIALAPLEYLISIDSIFVNSIDRFFNAILNPMGFESTPEIVRKGTLFTITVVAVTFFLVLFGEVSPKVYAKFNSLKLSKLMSKPLLVLRKIFYPLSSILVKSSTFLEKRLHKRTGNKLSAQEIDRAIELTVSKEKESDREVDILRSIVKFNNITVKQIMRSRVDVKSIDFENDFKDVMKQVKEWGYSRVPVFDEDFDNITGILHVKDLLGHISETNGFEWQELIRTNLMYVPESKKINDLLNEFQERRQHMGIVVDEYGGSSGIVTLEDVMEEVIGEIRDEFDSQREIDYQKINAYTYIFEGKTLLNDISKLIEIDMSLFEEVRGESDSIAGLILEMVGFIPSKGKTITFNNYTFEIISSTARRIQKVKIVLPH